MSDDTLTPPLSTPAASPSLVEAPAVEKIDDTVVISVQTGFDGYRLRNFYFTNSLQGFVWMVFHFSVVFFFTFLLDSVALVGIFLGFANLIAFFLDIPLGIIQRYIPTKRLFIIAAISQLIATGIFFAFIFQVFAIIHALGGAVTPDSIKSGMDWFFGSALNWIGVIVASICYGLTKEINDVATYGYVLSHANPDEYGKILARNNITFGIGSLLGLVTSGVILSFPPAFAIVVLGIIIVGFLAFTIRFFDNSVDSVTMADIESFRVSIQKWNKENVKEYIVEIVQKADLQKIIDSTKYLMIKPKQKKTDEKIPWKDVYQSSKKEFGIIYAIISHQPPYIALIWTIMLVLTFGFWDTFASSFLLDFLNEVKPGYSYILLAVIGVPGIVLQEYASKLASKIGAKSVGMIGLSLGGGSLMVMGVLTLFGMTSPAWIIGLALINSLGYACGMSTGQNQFLDGYNRIYAERSGLKEIDANASSGPIKVVQNLANVVGLVLGGFLLMLGFPAFFLIFGGTMIGILIWTIIRGSQIDL